MGKVAKYTDKAGIYKLISPSNKIYVGKSVNIRRRLHDHRNAKSGSYLKRAIDKYGWDSFTIEIVEIFENFNKLIDNASLLEREAFYINLYDSTDKNKGYNLCKHSTDRTGFKCSDEARKNMSLARKGIPLSEKHKESLRQAHLGKTLSKETREKMSEVRKGKKYVRKNETPIVKPPLSIETKEKIRMSRIGKKHSDKSREKMSRAKKGKPKSDQHKENISKALLKRNSEMKKQD